MHYAKGNRKGSINQMGKHQQSRVKPAIVYYSFIIILLCATMTNCSKSTRRNLFDKADKGKVYVNNQEILTLKLMEEITEYRDDTNEIHSFIPKAGTINYEDNLLYVLDRSGLSVIAFGLDGFGNNAQYITYSQKRSGKGPDEFNIPCDIVYDNNRDLLYLADLNNNCILCYNKNLQERDRIMCKKS